MSDEWEDIAVGPSSNDGWEDVSYGAPATTTPSWSQSGEFVGKSLLSGLANVADLGQNILNPGRLLAGQASSTKDMLGDFAKPETSGVFGPVADVARAGVEASVFPVGGPIANALSGVGAEVAHKIAPENPFAPLFGALFTGVGLTGLEKASTGLTKAGQAFERSSVGATAQDYLKSMKARGLIEDADTGELTTTLTKAIDEIGATEGWGLLRDPQRLAARNNAALKETGALIGTAVKVADQAGASPTINLLDEGSKTQKMIAGAKAEKGDLKEAFNEFLSRFTDPTDGWDGTVEGLNSWKTSIGNMAFSGTAKGTLKPALERRLQRAIYDDLGSAVNKAVVESGAVAPDKWATLNRVYSNHKALEPVINPDVASELAGTWAKTTRGLLRTSGGTLTTPTMIGGALGTGVGGPMLGLASGALLGAVSSPTGQGLTAKALKGAGSVSKLIAKDSLASPIAAIANSLFSPKTTTPEASPMDQVFTKPKAQEVESDVKPIKEVEAEIDKDPYYSALYEFESGRNPNAKNPKSTAKGGFQFINSTAKSLGLKDPFDLEQSFEAVKKMDSRNVSEFGDSPGMRYAAHYLGETTLRKLLKGEKLSPKQSEIVREFKNKILPKFEKTYKKVSSKMLEV